MNRRINILYIVTQMSVDPYKLGELDPHIKNLLFPLERESRNKVIKFLSDLITTEIYMNQQTVYRGFKNVVTLTNIASYSYWCNISFKFAARKNKKYYNEMLEEFLSSLLYYYSYPFGALLNLNRIKQWVYNNHSKHTDKELLICGVINFAVNQARKYPNKVLSFCKLSWYDFIKIFPYRASKIIKKVT